MVAGMVHDTEGFVANTSQVDPSSSREAAILPKLSQEAIDVAFSPELFRMVRGLATRLHMRLPQGCGIEVADLIQAGCMGLLKAAQNFEPVRGAPFALYAKFRVRGEMLDMVRRSAGRERTASFLRPTGTDGAECEASLPAPPESSPQISAVAQQRTAILHEELQRLSDRDRTLVRLRYSGEMSLREIGETLQVNESRACQIHQSVLTRLKRALWSRGVRSFSHL
jgi:RNA polymerase sigma factor FliA